MTWRAAACVGLFGLLIGVKPSVAAEGLLTFETAPAGPLPRGSTYTESGMQLTSFSDFSSFGDPFGAGGSGNWLYFHGTNQYVEFRLVDGAPFDLVSFEAVTNGYTDGRWVTASSGATQTFPGLSRQTVVLGPGFQGITWFRIGTPYNATQVDNVSFRADQVVGQCNSGEDVTISAPTAWPGGSYVCGHLRVTSGATLTLTESVNIAAVAITVEAGGVISADGAGFPSDQGPGRGGSQGLCGAYGGDAGGGGYGGNGGYGNYGVLGGGTCGSAVAPVDSGSGGGSCGSELGGNGGGAIRLNVANALTLNGSIRANGESGLCSATSCGGGGSGGSIFIGAGSISGTGQLTANGGDGQQGGGGGGGRIAVYYAASTFSGAAVASGGSGLAGVGEEGTIGFFDTATNDFSAGAAWRFQANDSPFNFNNVTLGNGSRSVMEAGVTFGANALVLGGSSRLRILGTDPLSIGSVQVSESSQLVGNLRLTADTLTIDAGSAISADGMGFPSDQGPGPGGFQDLCGVSGGDGGGGGYGGNGGPGSYGVIGGITYGSHSAPVDMGSGGGAACSASGGNGGGTIQLSVANTLTLNGTITANGQSGSCGAGFSCGGGGSGGSIFIRTGSIPGTGQLAANGGGGQDAGGGGGGRIALIYAPPAFAGTAEAKGAGNGQDGTVVLAETRLVISPSRGGDTGSVSVVISGVTFAANAVARLVRGSETIEGSTTTVSATGDVLRTTFDLTGRTRGEWDIVVDTGGSLVRLPNGFIIEEGKGPRLWSDILGSSAIRPGQPQRFWVLIGNRGDVDAYGPVLVVSAPQSAASTLLPLPAEVFGIGAAQLSDSTLVGNERVYSRLIPLLPPGSTVSLQLSVAAATPLTLRSWVAGPLFSGRPGETGAGLAKILSSTTDASTPLQDEISAAYDKEFREPLRRELPRLYEHAVSEAATGWGWGLALAGLIALGLAATGVTLTPGILGAIVVGTLGVLGLWAVKVISDLNPSSEKSVQIVQSRDPNDKVGSLGSGPPFFYVSGEEPLRYAVYFENVGSATAPAQDVVITDQLDADTVDLSTLTFGPVAFGDRLVELPAGGQRVETTVDLRPANDLLVRISAALDEATGRVEWRFSSLDPATGLPPEDPLAGFLPPNVNPPEGEGSVVFTVAPRPGLPTGTQIANQASIVFDTNEPILTPVWLNTINQPRCGPTPDTGCRHATAGASSLKIRDQADNTKDTFAWKWNKGDLTELVNFRDPVRGFNDYRVCVYDGSAKSQPLMEAEVFPGENCGGAKCWKQAGKTGLKFKSKLGVPDGITTLTLKAGPAGKAKLLAKGKGPNLELPTIPLTGPVTVQFIVNDGRSRGCWEATYTSPSRNEAGTFDAKGP